MLQNKVKLIVPIEVQHTISGKLVVAPDSYSLISYRIYITVEKYINYYILLLHLKNIPIFKNFIIITYYLY